MTDSKNQAIPQEGTPHNGGMRMYKITVILLAGIVFGLACTTKEPTTPYIQPCAGTVDQVLNVICEESSLRTTGKPICLATSTASSAERVAYGFVVGMP